MTWSDRFTQYSYPAQTHTRFIAVRILNKIQIPCIIWGEDMLSNVYHVPTLLFDMHLLVLDEAIPKAASSILESGLPYHVNPSAIKTWPEATVLRTKEDFQRFIPLSRDLFFDPKNLPTRIILHPASSFHFDVTDPSRSFTPCLALLPECNKDIRYPTLPAALESFFTSWVTPLPCTKTSAELVDFRLMIRVWSDYIHKYSLDEPCYPEEQEDFESQDRILSESARRLVVSFREDMRGMAERFARKDFWPDEHSGELPELSEAWHRQFGDKGDGNLHTANFSSNMAKAFTRHMHTISGYMLSQDSIKSRPAPIRKCSGGLQFSRQVPFGAPKFG
ncbi:hypothetical protein VKT23_013012 [Stygiomarasmius scandens]|uniref:Uncharacterized protein n=1 Tax=Marasmiellus scandens TaxID=2682957 RepID=A0ABR1J5I5_9AGAR